MSTIKIQGTTKTRVTEDLKIKPSGVEEVTVVASFSGLEDTSLSGKQPITVVPLREFVDAPDPTKDSHYFEGWNPPLPARISKDTEFTAIFSSAYVVAFVAWHGGPVLKTETAKWGRDATPPWAEREGHFFTGWDVSYMNVKTNITVTGTWEKYVFAVYFYGVNEDLLKIERVEWGGNASAPPTNSDSHIFIRWNESYANIRKTTHVYSTWVIRQRKLTFIPYAGADQITILVDHGSVIERSAPTRSFYTFVKWDKIGQVVTRDTEVYGIWRADTGYYTISASLATDPIPHGQGGTVRIAPRSGAPAAVSVNWADTRSIEVTDSMALETQIRNIQTGENATVDRLVAYFRTEGSGNVAVIDRDFHLLPQGFTILAPIFSFKEITSHSFIVEIKNPTNYVDVSATWQVTSPYRPGGPAMIAKNGGVIEHSFTGLESSKVHSVYAAFRRVGLASVSSTASVATARKWNVTFYDDDYAAGGEVLKTESVHWGASATPPADPTKTGHTFNRWSGLYTNVDRDSIVTATWNINRYTVSFNTQPGLLEPQTVNYNSTVSIPSSPTKTGYDFKGWSETAQGSIVNLSTYRVTKNVTLYATWEIKKFTVVFRDWDNKHLVTRSVSWSGNAIPPTNYGREGHTFKSWSGTYTNVRANQTVVATYDINTYIVRFYDYVYGTLRKEQRVEWGSGATAPTVTREGYDWKGWDKSFNNVTAPINVHGTWEIKRFIVRFVDWDGAPLSDSTVNWGTNATPPSNPTRLGYSFTSWDGTYTNVRSNEVVIAQYSLNTYRVRFYDYSGGPLRKTQTVGWGAGATAPTVPNREAHDWKGWDKSFSSIKANTDVFGTWELKEFRVRFYQYPGGGLLSTQSVKWGHSAVEPTYGSRTGLDWSGWDKPRHNIRTNTDIFGTWTTKMFTVRFLKFAGGPAISSQSVEWGGNATPPGTQSEPYHTHRGWDGEISNIRKDETVLARWAPDPNYYNVILDWEWGSISYGNRSNSYVQVTGGAPNPSRYFWGNSTYHTHSDPRNTQYISTRNINTSGVVQNQEILCTIETPLSTESTTIKATGTLFPYGFSLQGPVITLAARTTDSITYRVANNSSVEVLLYSKIGGNPSTIGSFTRVQQNSWVDIRETGLSPDRDYSMYATFRLKGELSSTNVTTFRTEAPAIAPGLYLADEQDRLFMNIVPDTHVQSAMDQDRTIVLQPVRYHTKTVNLTGLTQQVKDKKRSQDLFFFEYDRVNRRLAPKTYPSVIGVRWMPTQAPLSDDLKPPFSLGKQKAGEIEIGDFVANYINQVWNEWGSSSGARQKHYQHHGYWYMNMGLALFDGEELRMETQPFTIRIHHPHNRKSTWNPRWASFWVEGDIININ